MQIMAAVSALTPRGVAAGFTIMLQAKKCLTNIGVVMYNIY